MRTLIPVAIACVFLAQGCATGTPAGNQPVNQTCPIMDEDIDPEVTVSFQGQTIALCCEDCIPKWQRMSASDKSEALQKVQAGASQKSDGHDHQRHEH